MMIYDCSFNEHCISHIISNGGKWEPHVDEFIKDQKISGNMIDVGGDIGTFSIGNSDVFNEIYVFEPSVERFNIISDSVSRFGYSNIHPYNKAVGEKNGRGILTTQYENQINIQDDGDVDIISIDSLNLENITFVKIDTEGFEDYVLMGMLGLLKQQNPYLFIETHSTIRMESLTKTNELLSNLGYSKILEYDCEGGIYKKL